MAALKPLVAVAVLVAALAFVRGLDAADMRPAPLPGPGTALALPAAEVARPCPGLEPRASDGPPRDLLAVFARTQHEPDGIPAVDGADGRAWIPAGTVYPRGSRRPGRERFVRELHLIPVAGLRTGGCERPAGDGLGVCLAVGVGRVAVRCFSQDEIAGGRALAATFDGMLHGIAPDGIAAVTLRWTGGAVTVGVVENAFEALVPVRAGATVRVELEPAPTCAPTPELLDAVPALRDGGWTMLPAAAEDAMPTGGRRQWARRLDGDGLELWLVSRCEDAARACVLAIRDGRWTAQPCGTAREIRERGSAWTHPVVGTDRLGVTGLAPPSADTVDVVLDDELVHRIAVTEGAFGGVLPPAFGSSVDPGEGRGEIDLRFRSR